MPVSPRSLAPVLALVASIGVIRADPGEVERLLRIGPSPTFNGVMLRHEGLMRGAQEALGHLEAEPAFPAEVAAALRQVLAGTRSDLDRSLLFQPERRGVQPGDDALLIPAADLVHGWLAAFQLAVNQRGARSPGALPMPPDYLIDRFLESSRGFGHRAPAVLARLAALRFLDRLGWPLATLGRPLGGEVTSLYERWSRGADLADPFWVQSESDVVRVADLLLRSQGNRGGPARLDAAADLVTTPPEPAARGGLPPTLATVVRRARASSPAPPPGAPEALGQVRAEGEDAPPDEEDSGALALLALGALLAAAGKLLFDLFASPGPKKGPDTKTAAAKSSLDSGMTPLSKVDARTQSLLAMADDGAPILTDPAAEASRPPDSAMEAAAARGTPGPTAAAEAQAATPSELNDAEVLEALTGGGDGNLPPWLAAALKVPLGTRYKDQEVLGAGGMGTVVVAWDSRLGRKVAIKVPPPHLAHQDEFRERFLREAQALARLQHENITIVHDVPEVPDSEIPVMIMEFIEGFDLMSKVQESGLPKVNDTLRWIVQASRGLQHAHEQGIYHRDVKPANLMVTVEDKVKVLDFGLAAVTDLEQLTQAGMRLGSAPYMPPEQLAGERVDHLADQYALAVTAYFLFSGRLPFDPEDPKRSDPPLISLARAGLPSQFDAVFQKALAPYKADRFESIAEFGATLMSAAREAGQNRG